MISYLNVRIISLLITAAVVLVFRADAKALMLFIAIMAIGHYSQALAFSHKQLSAIARQKSTWLPAAALCSIGPAFYLIKFPIVVFFGIHHVFNDVYVLHQQVFGGWRKEQSRLRGASITLGLLVYLATLRHDPTLAFLYGDLRILAGVLVVGYLLYFLNLWRMRHQLSREQMIELSAGDLACLPLLALSGIMQLGLLHVIFYHGMLWMLYPIQMTKPAEWRKSARALVLMTAILLFFYLFAPYSPSPIKLTFDQWFKTFIAMGYAHISISFAVSKMHPSVIRNLCAARLHPKSESFKDFVKPSIEIEAVRAFERV